MTSYDGSVVGVTTVVDHGPPANRFDIAVVGELYPLAQVPLFAGRVRQFVDVLLATAPFDVLQGAVNVHRIDIAAGPDGAFAPTRGDGRARRLLTVDSASVLAVVARHVPAYDMVVVQVNDERYGGSGGAVATFSSHPAAAEIALHEMGHTAFGLGDEYDGGTGAGAAPDVAGPAASAAEYPNISRTPDRQLLPWRDLVLPGTRLPTRRAPPGTVGAFEGADYVMTGAFRPEFDCRMRTLGQPFCAVCRRAIRRQVLRYVTNTG